MKNDEVRITLRLPPTLHAQLVALASQDERSLNRQIVRLLQVELRRQTSANSQNH